MEQVSRVRIFGLDKKSVEAGRRLGKECAKHYPLHMVYSEKLDTITITMPSGTQVIIPRLSIAELSTLPKNALKHLYLSKLRDSFEVDEYDIQISAMGLLRDAVFGEDHYAKAGRITSRAKARAARRNGAKGGRPRKKARR